ncbi:hypothetical protein QFC24_001402 [Naganishia onofrii]|uniref:Uncharacterized protein n=1 Tax=Naganishia onofrii TaxID=1851511 RepID=A0ACC2XSZ2_9TREE|nr:hypothetical protein QFC24_001402 [Naganishia onofrii]
MFRPITAITRVSRIHARSYAAVATPASTSPATATSEHVKITHSPSSIPPGTILKDLSILKDKPDPVALPDEEYPAWLWTLTDEWQVKTAAAGGAAPSMTTPAGKGKAGGGGEFDLKAEKKKLRAT